MALAILQFLESDGVKSRFHVDLGTNRFYTYAIGGDEVQRVNGLKMLQDPIYTSPLIGPIPEESLGRTNLEVPNEKFDRQHRAIQITSFRDRQRVGPAISDIVTVMSVAASPATSFSLSTAMETAMNQTPVETVPFQYREVSPVSETMGLGGILNAAANAARSVVGAVTKAAPTVLKTVAQVAPAVIGAVSAGTPAAGAGGAGGVGNLLGSVMPQLAGAIAGVLPQLTGGANSAAIDSNQIANLLMVLLQQIGSAPAIPGQTEAASTANNAASPSSTDSAATSPSSPQPIMNSAPVASRRSLGRSQSLAMSVQNYYPTSYGLALLDEDADDVRQPLPYADSLSADYSEPMFLPMLAGALPSISGVLATVVPKLLPALPSILSSFGPNLMNILNSLLNPQKATSGQMSMMLGLDDHEDGEDHATLIALSLAIAASATPDLVYHRVGAVTLTFTDVTPVMMHGKSRLLYRHDQDISFPLKLETPQPVKKAKLQLLVKHPKTLKVLIEQNYHLEKATAGAVSVVPKLSKEQLKKLAVNEEYLICVSLVWQGRSKKTQQVMRLGTSTMQLITLVGEYLFDRVEGTGQTVPLNDVERFRPYWHKVWQGDFTEDVRRMNFECKYYYVLETHRTENARMETVTQVLEEDLAGRKSRLKSGLIVSPYGLNALLGQVFNHPQLSEAELAALVSSEFKGRFSHAARTEVKFSGKPRQTVALWVYPEFKLQQVFLKQVDQSNGNSHVLSLKEHPVYFPMPAMAHFIGAST